MPRTDWPDVMKPCELIGLVANRHLEKWANFAKLIGPLVMLNPHWRERFSQEFHWPIYRC